MYYYLYDSFLQDKKYAKLLSEVEARLIDLSIQGRTTKLTFLNDIKELIADAVKRGAETVVVLGDDKTMSKAINAVVNLNVTLGIIPMGQNTVLAQYLGIPQGLLACEVLSRRITEKIDVGKIDGNYFAFCLKAFSPHIRIVSPDNQYRITPLSANMEVSIYNFNPPQINLDFKKQSTFFRPQDGQMEAVIRNLADSSLIGKLFSPKSKKINKIGEYTILPFKRIKLEPMNVEQDTRLLLDNDKMTKLPVEIEILPSKITLIVGKDRIF